MGRTRSARCRSRSYGSWRCRPCGRALGLPFANHNIGAAIARVWGMRPREKKLADSLIAAALGLLVVTPIFDVVLFITKNPLWGHVGFWTLTVGLLGGLMAVGAETWEF